MKTTSEAIDLRSKLLTACMHKQQLLIDDFKERIKALTETEGLGNEESYDNSDVAAGSQKTMEINTINSLLEFAETELKVLETIKHNLEKRRRNVSLGAIVFTDRNTFFISASLEHFTVEGNKYLGISTKSPLYSAMEGKKVGDSFEYKDKRYIIKDIF
jgi:hypothetical protein